MKRVPARDAVFAVLAVVLFLGWITLLRLAPSDGAISAFLDTWYGWPVAIALGMVAIYAVIFAFTLIRLVLKARKHGV